MRLGMQGLGAKGASAKYLERPSRGARTIFVRERSRSFGVARFFSTLVPNTLLEKSQQKPYQLENQRAKCLPTWTLRVYKWAHLLLPIPLFRLFNCARHDSDKRADSNTGGTFRTVGFRVVAPRCPGNVEMCPRNAVSKLL